MNTPICDFIDRYIEREPLRFHMPGHKGEGDMERFDITEIDGADSLFEASGIILESERNAGSIFDAHTFYSCEGSSLSIRAMVYLALTYGKLYNRDARIIAARNAHKSFLYACGVLNVDICWLESGCEGYLSAEVSASDVEEAIRSGNGLPLAVYITTPDYLGKITELREIADVCKKYNVLLLVDNAHGAYLKLAGMHPIDMGADMVCDSAHKTLPVLTGGAYLHVNKNAPEYLYCNAKNAMAVFASTSPSYLILRSLDKANVYLGTLKMRLEHFVPFKEMICSKLVENGYELYGNEPLKITVKTKPYGYSGAEFKDILKKKNITVEFYDPDFCVFMLTPNKTKLMALAEVLLAIPKREPINVPMPLRRVPERVMSVGEALLCPEEKISVKNALGRVLASPSVACPPAVPVIACGERIDDWAQAVFEYYGIRELTVVKEI